MLKKLWIRVLLLLLTVIMAFSVTSCADTTDNDNNSGDGTTATTLVTDEGGKQDPIPADVNFNDAKLKILYWSDVEHPEFFEEEQTGDSVSNALYDRNMRVEERLGVEIVWEPQEGDSGNNTKWNERVRNIIADNATEQYTCFAGYSLSVAASAVNGSCYNLLSDDCGYLNFNDNTYWPERLLKEVTFGDNLYFCSGDISANALYMMYTCFANTDMLTDYNLQNPQELVESGEWTYQRFVDMCENIYVDTDTDAKKSAGDTFGYMTGGVHTDVWFYGTGALIAEYDEENKLTVSDSFSGDAVTSAYEMIQELVKSTNYGIHTGTASSDVKHQKAFAEGRVLFVMDRCRISFKIIAAGNYDVNYVILPCPKYNKKQESYVTLMGNPFTLYGMFYNASEENRKMGAAFLEYYAYESYRIVTPAVFELSLKTKYVQDDISARMYDLIRENLSFDIGRIFSSDVLNNAGGQTFMRSLFTGTTMVSWQTTIYGKSKQINDALQVLQTTLDK